MTDFRTAVALALSDGEKPNGWHLIKADAVLAALVTEEVVNAAYAWMGAHDVVLTDDALQGLITLLAASPNGGSVTDADLERAARAAWSVAIGVTPWEDLGPDARAFLIAQQRAALTALGLTVADAPAGVVVDG